MHLVNNIDCIPNWVTECYALCLNRMRGKAEEVDAVIFSDCREDLINYIKQEKAEEPWEDTEDMWYLGSKTWRKAFKKGSPLEWRNLPFGDYEDPYYVDPFGAGIRKLQRVMTWQFV